jgi:hypothetical protein
MIQDQPIPHPRPAVVTYQPKTAKTKMFLHGELIAGHGRLK